MTEQQEHLKNVIEQQTAIIREIDDLSAKLNMKKEMALKLQGIREYLVGVGVELPEEEAPEAPVEEAKELEPAA